MHRDRRMVAEDRSYWPVWENTLERAFTEDPDDVETCTCPELRFSANVLHCPICGTIWAVAMVKSYRSGWSRLSWEVCLG